MTLLAHAPLPDLVLLEDYEDLFMWHHWHGNAYSWEWRDEVQVAIQDRANEGFAESFF